MKKYSHENTLWEKIRRAETKEFIRKRIYYLCLILFSLCIIIGIVLLFLPYRRRKICCGGKKN
ncbi:hypothetical protein BACPEC_02011 [[Bacteroides] pectinophilus ATCC 43243]|uniref:Uncharacterized protein n=1 Tax=[Bacteroides] pectinophilus ATCC 43243 TaxID=483218 RepID=B7ASF6_9FIRM|nr:hypothetical protein BACPEC_02011 [[Bacteroides] pectinophilus ATCC 43243]